MGPKILRNFMLEVIKDNTTPRGIYLADFGVNRGIGGSCMHFHEAPHAKEGDLLLSIRRNEVQVVG